MIGFRGLGDTVGPPSLDVQTQADLSAYANLFSGACPTGYTTAVDGSCITAVGYAPGGVFVPSTTTPSGAPSSTPASGQSFKQWIEANQTVIIVACAVIGGVVALTRIGK